MHDVSRKEKYCINVQLNPYFRSLLLVHVSEISRGNYLQKLYVIGGHLS